MSCCKEAMVENVISIAPDETVSAAIEKLLEHCIRLMPVVDSKGIFHGVFNFHQVLKKILPFSATMEGAFELKHLDFLQDDFPALKEKLEEVKVMKVSEVMEVDVPLIHSDTSFWETLLSIYKYGRPLPVVDEKSNKFIGLFSEQAAISYLQKNINNN